MKYRIFTLILAMVLIVSLFCGCSAETPAVENVPTLQEAAVAPQRVADSSRKVEEDSAIIYSMDPNAPIVRIPDESVPLAAAPGDGTLTKRDAESIGVQHAGFEINQVSFLFTKLVENEDGQHYEVNFRVGADEYEINVHPETGEILEYSKVNING